MILKSQRTKPKNGPEKTKEKTSKKIMIDKAPAPRILFSNWVRPMERFHGSAERKAVNPSKGGNGMRLNSPRNRFTKEIVAASEIAVASKPSIAPQRTKRPKIIARNRFVALPAIATRVSPQRLLRRLYGLYGTGRAQPKRIGELEKTRSAGIIIEPMRSIWGTGFRVRRPAIRAVGSPRESAA